MSVVTTRTHRPMRTPRTAPEAINRDIVARPMLSSRAAFAAEISRGRSTIAVSVILKPLKREQRHRIPPGGAHAARSPLGGAVKALPYRVVGLSIGDRNRVSNGEHGAWFACVGE